MNDLLLSAAEICILQDEKVRLEAMVEIMTEALEHLAKLGNEPLYGTSEGNMIAKIALVRAERV